jgi:hypothetical protein
MEASLEHIAQLRVRPVQIVVQDRTVFQLYWMMGLWFIESQQDLLTCRSEAEPGLLAVTPRVIHAKDWQDVKVREPADASHLLGQDLLLEGQLGGIVDVLPVTAATTAEERAGRIDSVR